MARLGFIRRGIRSRVSWGEGLARSFLAVLVPTLLRWLIDEGSFGAPFVLYFPAILMMAVLLGWFWASLTAIGSSIVAGVVLMGPWRATPDSWGEMVILILFALSAISMIVIGQFLRSVVLEIEERARQSEEFNLELQHRTKNALQMMRALASRASKATDPAAFYEKLEGRLGALAKANELLRFGASASCEMKKLVGAAMAPFNAQQIIFSGPDCQVTRNGCTPLMMALHELGTNASKYGALSREGGRVRLSWRPGEAGDCIELEWDESGGPPVVPPSHKGIGTRLLTRNGDLRDVALDYRPHGLLCRMTVVQSQGS